MANKILFHVFVLRIAKLPLWLLYKLSDILFLLFITILPYRRKVIRENLKRAFPGKSDIELKRTRRQFYRYLADLFVEGLKNLTIKEKELRWRIKVSNPAVMNDLRSKKKNVLLVGGHYGNWEWIITAQSLLFEQQAIGLGKPLSNAYFDEKINALRGRFGMKIVNSSNYKGTITQDYANGFAMLTLSDQSPGDSLKSYWTDFLNQKTAVLFGAEQMAHQYDLAVVFFKLSRPKRGFYEMDLELICESPKNMKYGEITEKHTHLLEQQIIEKPELWLWSHKKWKREIPENLNDLMQKHKERFEFKNKPHR